MYKIVHYLIHKPDQDHSDIETSQNSLELPFSLMLEYEFKRRNIRVQVQEVNFDFLKDPVPAFLKKYGIEKDHFVCFAEAKISKSSTFYHFLYTIYHWSRSRQEYFGSSSTTLLQGTTHQGGEEGMEHQYRTKC